MLDQEKENKALLQEQKIKERKEYLAKIANQRESRVKMNKELLKTGNQRFKKIMKTIPIYQRLEEEYNQSHSLSSQTIYPKASVDIQSLDRHAENYQYMRDALLQKKILDRKHAMRVKILENRRAQSRLYKSKYLENVLHDNIRFKEKLKDRDDLAQIRKNRIKNYEKNIRELFKPKVSENKRKEIENRINRSNKPRSKAHNEYSSHSRQSPLISDNFKDDKRFEKRSSSVSSINTKYKKRRFKPNPMLPESKARREPIQLNYLENKRKLKGPIAERDYKEYTPYKWDSHTKGKEGMDKFESIYEKAQQITVDEDMQEQYLRTKNPGSISLDQSKNLNGMLIDAIKAKLSLLDDL